jgi:tetratricopeptide (TPR) repeat protein
MHRKTSATRGCPAVMIRAMIFFVVVFSMPLSPTKADTPKTKSRQARQDSTDRTDQTATSKSLPDPSNKSSSKPDYQALLRSMSKADFATRRLIARQLWNDREQSREIIQAATHDDDPEIAGRAQWILKQWQKGILPGVSPKVAGLLTLSKENDKLISTLLDMGEFRTQAIAIAESGDSKSKAEIRKLTADYLQQYFIVYVTRALANGTLGDLWNLVDQVAETEELCLTRIEMMGLLDIEIDNTNLLPPVSATWDPNKIQRFKVMLWAALENDQEARKAAGDSVDLLQRLAIVTRDVETLTQVDSILNARSAAIAIIASDWIEDDQVRSQKLDAILNHPILQGELTPAENLMLVHSLGCVGQMKQVRKRLENVDAIETSTFFAFTNQYQEAMDALELDLEDVGASVEKDILQSLTSARDVRPDNQTPEKFRRALQWLKIQFQIGNELGGWQLADRIWQTLARAEVTEDNVELFARIRGELLGAVSETEQKERLLGMLTGKAQGVTNDDFDFLITLLTDCDRSSFSVILAVITDVFSDRSTIEHAMATVDLFEGRIPTGFDPDQDFVRLVDSLVRPDQSDRLTRLRSQGESGLIIVRMLQRHQQYELAERYFEQMLSDGDVPAFLQLAQKYLRSGSADSALEQYQSIIESDSPLQNSSSSDWINAVVGEAVALDRLSIDDLSEKAWEQVDWISLSPDPNERMAMATELAETGHHRTIVSSLSRIAVISCFDDETAAAEPLRLYSIADAFDSLRKSDAISSTRKRAACMNAAWWYPLAIDAVDHPAFQIRWMLGFSYRSGTARLDSAILEQNETLAARSVDRLLTIQPLDILFAENTVPRLKDAGWDQLSTSSLDRVLENGQTHLNAFPLDAGVCNNLAWVAAKSDRALPSALKWSRLAVDRFPESTVYRDTLAEVLFHLDRPREALQIEQDCLLDDPGQWHLHEQIERFESVEN